MARIRTIKPEFWDSPSTAKAGPWARLAFIAMWNWADDFGRGTLNYKELEGFIFPNDSTFTDRSGNTVQFRDVVAEVSECFGVALYEVDERMYYEIPSWERHQRNERRAKASKHPEPTPESILTRGDAEMHGISATAERKCADGVAEDARNGSLGTGEQGNRGTGEHAHAPAGADDLAAPADADAVFEQWWKHYPLKRGRAKAEKAFAKALEKTDIDTLTDAVIAYAESVATTERRFIAHATTWLNGERWDDEVDKPAPVNPYWDRAQLAADRGVPECWI